MKKISTNGTLYCFKKITYWIIEIFSQGNGNI